MHIVYRQDQRSLVAQVNAMAGFDLAPQVAAMAGLCLLIGASLVAFVRAYNHFILEPLEL
jgi:hypothetical protein